jgi:hypothetical protein
MQIKPADMWPLWAQSDVRSCRGAGGAARLWHLCRGRVGRPTRVEGGRPTITGEGHQILGMRRQVRREYSA